uniref:Spermatogenesis-defective protein 39 homolog n=1 Tax=Cebus imitator TaxID=2715852 RepID=A0A2K5PXJ2_CEBIM
YNYYIFVHEEFWFPILFCLFLFLYFFFVVNSLRDFVDDDDDDLERVTWTGELVGIISCFFRGRTRLGSFQSLSDTLSDTSAKSYAPELGRPKGGYRDYSNDWSPSDTVQRLRKGKVCSLERFCSLQDKLQLLEKAVSMQDGNVITAVLIFLKRTLSKEILFRELEVRQIALRQLVHFLKEIGDQKLLLDLFRFLDRTEELATLTNEKNFLRPVLILHTYRTITCSWDVRSLLRLRSSESTPRKASILNMPLVTTLFYSCSYHYMEAEGTFSSPVNLKKTFKYVLTAPAARAELRAWNDVDALFTTKNWLGCTKKRAPIGFHRVNNALVQILQEYVKLVEDVDTKLNLATKFKCHDVIIDTCRDLKDRQQLLAYWSKVDKGSAEEEKIDALLSSSQIRWKN